MKFMVVLVSVLAAVVASNQYGHYGLYSQDAPESVHSRRDIQRHAESESVHGKQWPFSLSARLDENTRSRVYSCYDSCTLPGHADCESIHAYQQEQDTSRMLIPELGGFGGLYAYNGYPQPYPQAYPQPYPFIPPQPLPLPMPMPLPMPLPMQLPMPLPLQLNPLLL